MPSPSHRPTHSRPSRPSKAHHRHAADREERKERGTPEKSHSRTPKRRTHSPERSPTRERTPHRRTRSPERREQRRRRSPERKAKRERISEKHESYESTNSASGLLSSNALAQLDALNEKTAGEAPRVKERVYTEQGYSERRSTKEKVVTGRVAKDKVKHRRKSDGRHERRRVSGPLAEEGRAFRRRRGGYVDADEHTERRRYGKKFWIILGVILILLIVIIVMAVVVAKRKSGGAAGSGSGGGGGPDTSNLKGISESDIPTSAKNTALDPFTWYDTKDFNVTYTNETIGGLPVMGLDSEWDDKTQANSNVPSLDKPWAYGKMPIRGINIGGWLSLEPFITPSMFNTYKANDGIVDEWTLSKKLGPSQAAQTLEKHYDTFITEQDFADIQGAGFDHVRIPYSYWAVATYADDPYVPKISWRYLLRGIEYARKHGLRVNLDLHALPGSQNGWNHSGRQGPIGWLSGPDGDLNAQRSLDLHNQLATFFAQPRYANVITIYGLVNEPKMITLPVPAVVNWTTAAIQVVRRAGMKQTIAFGDGFMGLDKWQGELQGMEGLVLDAHEYVVFDANMIDMPHQKKLQYACTGWQQQMSISMSTTTGFGATLCGEWSQADTDCANNLNDVGAGNRWEGTLQSSDRSVAVTSPDCPSKSNQCSCKDANAAPNSYSDGYKQWLMMNAQAQMISFETAWGWFYWTWTTEGATQWDYKAGMAAGILPEKTWDRSFNCSDDVPHFPGLSENY